MQELELANTVAETPAPVARGSTSLLGISGRQSILPRTQATTSAPAEQRFVPIRLLGKGGLGEVTLVRDNDIDRSVAVKRLLSDTGDHLHQFAREVRTAGRLEHPNVAPVHDVGVDDHGRPYFVMRYVEGETLEMVIAQLACGDPEFHRRFPNERRIEIFLGVLHAIRYAHAKGIVHRDIKPANIMIGPFGEVQLMDWGVAKDRSSPASPVTTEDGLSDDSVGTTRAGSLVGTPLYMSPEQAQGRIDAIDERSDVYALCVVFYELLALRHYLPDETSVTGLLHAIAETDHVKACYVPSEYQTPVPAELSWYIEKGLAKDPAARYQSVTEMIETLTRVTGGDFPAQCPVTLMKRIGGAFNRLADRRPRIAIFSVVAMSVVVLFALVSLIRLIS